mmetsp:Transcript_24066/g.57428  ORF Transcript_24066/g.57428 Transcript_24066/m.57428 type:complete len:387 (+) Transcript_24066:444-1604(+)
MVQHKAHHGRVPAEHSQRGRRVCPGLSCVESRADGKIEPLHVLPVRDDERLKRSGRRVVCDLLDEAVRGVGCIPHRDHNQAARRHGEEPRALELPCLGVHDREGPRLLVSAKAGGEVAGVVRELVELGLVDEGLERGDHALAALDAVHVAEPLATRPAAQVPSKGSHRRIAPARDVHALPVLADRQRLRALDPVDGQAALGRPILHKVATLELRGVGAHHKRGHRVRVVADGQHIASVGADCQPVPRATRWLSLRGTIHGLPLDKRAVRAHHEGREACGKLAGNHHKLPGINAHSHNCRRSVKARDRRLKCPLDHDQPGLRSEQDRARPRLSWRKERRVHSIEVDHRDRSPRNHVPASKILRKVGRTGLQPESEPVPSEEDGRRRL